MEEQVNLNDLKIFLNVLFPNDEGDFIALQLFHAKGNSAFVPLQDFYISKEELVEAFPVWEQRQKEGYDLFLGVCVFTEPKRTHETFKYVNVLWADVDAKDFGNDKDAALKSLHAFQLKPTLIIDSGHGYHGYWQLKEIQNDAQLVKETLINISNAINGDRKVCEVARVMRIPGTTNNKGKDSLTVSIIEKNDVVYALADFDFLLEKDTSLIEKKESSVIDAEIMHGERNSTLTSLAGSLFRRIHDYEVVLSALKNVNNALCKPPLQESEVCGIAESIFKAETSTCLPTAPIANGKKYLSFDDLKSMKPLHVDWIWNGYLARGYITLLSGLPKAGKSTLLFHLIKAIKAREPFLDFSTRFETRVLIVSEERSGLYGKRIHDEGLSGDDVFLLSAFEEGCHSSQAVLEQIKMSIRQDQVSLVVIDTLGEFWGVAKENEATDVSVALKPFKLIAQQHNVAVLLIHHLRKADGDHGTAHRGSGALLGGVDIGLEFKYSNDNVPNRRRIVAKSRFSETPEELMVEKGEDGYCSLGDASLFNKESVKNRFLEALTNTFERLSDIAQRMEPRPSDSLLGEVAKECFQMGVIDFTGKGKKGSPFQYRKLTLTG